MMSLELSPISKGDDIQERLVDFAVRIIKVCNQLPDTTAGRHIANQLLRSGTSAAPNYAEARSAESKRDFVHKLGIVLKELNESKVWLLIIARSDMLPLSQLNNLHNECEELSKIIGQSIQTASAPLKR